MGIATGTVVAGKVEVEGLELPEGLTVTIVIPEPEAKIHLPDRSARLRAAVETDPSFDAEISSLELLNDVALWNAAQTRMPPADSERMEELHRKQRLTGLSEAEAQELARFERQYERMVLVRSHSAWLLEQRGHDIRSLTSGGESHSSAPGEIPGLTPGE